MELQPFGAAKACLAVDRGRITGVARQGVGSSRGQDLFLSKRGTNGGEWHEAVVASSGLYERWSSCSRAV